MGKWGRVQLPLPFQFVRMTYPHSAQQDCSRRHSWWATRDPLFGIQEAKTAQWKPKRNSVRQAVFLLRATPDEMTMISRVQGTVFTLSWHTSRGISSRNQSWGENVPEFSPRVSLGSQIRRQHSEVVRTPWLHSSGGKNTNGVWDQIRNTTYCVYVTSPSFAKQTPGGAWHR